MAIGKAKAKQRNVTNVADVTDVKQAMGNQSDIKEKAWHEEQEEQMMKDPIYAQLVRNVKAMKRTRDKEDSRIEAKIAEIIELDTPFGRMVDKLNKAILANDIEGIRAAGIEMNSNGGMFTMQEAVEFFVKREFRRLVDMSWDGIGAWRG